MTQWVPVPIRRSVERLWEDINDTFTRWLDRPAEQKDEEREFFPASIFQHTTGPAIDLVEKDDEIIVNAELPGLNQDDFKVELIGDRLSIQGEKKSAREEKKRNYYYSECRYGSFSRSVRLPCEVEADRAEATFKNGVLKLRLPKTEAAKSRSIKIKID